MLHQENRERRYEDHTGIPGSPAKIRLPAERLHERGMGYVYPGALPSAWHRLAPYSGFKEPNLPLVPEGTLRKFPSVP